MTDPDLPIKVLTFGEAVRKRPGMYAGNPGPEMLQHLINELVSNVIDQYLRGAATHLNVVVHADGDIEVSDDGPGLPFDEPGPDMATSRASAYLQEPHFTANADGCAPHVHVHSLWGVGLAVVNQLSSSFICRSWRQGHLWEQCFIRGEALSPAHVVAEGDGRGTTVVFRPISEIVCADIPDRAVLRATLWKAVHLFGGLKISCDAERFYAPEGLRDYVHVLECPGTVEEWRWHSRPSFHWRGHHANVHIDAVARGFGESRCSWHSWVNGRATPLHGSHVQGFAQLLEQQGWTPAIALLHVTDYDPRFANPTRDQLASETTRAAVQEALAAAVEEYCRQHKIGNHAES